MRDVNQQTETGTAIDDVDDDSSIGMTMASTRAAAVKTSKYYISLTCILVPALKFPRFGYYTIPIVPQAKHSEGNIQTKTIMRNGINYTMTVWESRLHMRKFMMSGAHAKAMKEDRGKNGNIGVFAQTYGYDGNDIPDWDEAIPLLQKKGHVHYDHRPKTDVETSWSSSAAYVASTAAVLAIVGYVSTQVLGEATAPM